MDYKKRISFPTQPTYLSNESVSVSWMYGLGTLIVDDHQTSFVNENYSFSRSKCNKRKHAVNLSGRTFLLTFSWTCKSFCYVREWQHFYANRCTRGIDNESVLNAADDTGTGQLEIFGILFLLLLLLCKRKDSYYELIWMEIDLLFYIICNFCTRAFLLLTSS